MLCNPVEISRSERVFKPGQGGLAAQSTITFGLFSRSSDQNTGAFYVVFQGTDTIQDALNDYARGQRQEAE